MLAFLLPLGLYLALGMVLALGRESIATDALARVGSAYAVLFGRDPHLAAIGFVWSPLPALTTLPLVAAKAWWPSLVELGFAANVSSALFAAGAAYQLWAMLGDLRVARVPKILLTLGFAVHPLVVISGANGLSEGHFLFFLMLTVRYLSRWLASGSLASLVLCAGGLTLAYLTRYEGAVAALGALLVVCTVSAARASGAWRVRALYGAADGIVLIFPFAAAFVVWAVLSWLLTGSPFEQLTSLYGNASQVGSGLGDNVNPRPGWSAEGFLSALRWPLALEPFLPFVMAAGALIAVARRDARFLAPLGVFGAVLAFATLAWVSGTTTGVLRFHIVAVPLTVVVSALACAYVAGVLPPRGGTTKAFGTALAAAFIALPLATGAASATAAVFDPTLGPEEERLLRPLASDARSARESRRAYQEIARSIDSLTAGPGSILVDAFDGVPIIVLSAHPERLVITSDRDFAAHLADPAGRGVRYVLVPPQVEYGKLDAINRAYPRLYQDGGGLAVLTRSFESSREDLRWRLYEVLP